MLAKTDAMLWYFHCIMEYTMQSIPKRVFTHEYRAEAVKLVTEQGMGVTKAAKKLTLSAKTYLRWGCAWLVQVR